MTEKIKKTEKVKINKKDAITCVRLKIIIRSIILIPALSLIGMVLIQVAFFIINSGETDSSWVDFAYPPFFNLSVVIFSVIFSVIYGIVDYFKLKLKINSLEYSVNVDDKIFSWSYKIIAKTQNELRLQILNGIKIEQTVLESFFKLFSVVLWSRNVDGSVYIRYLSETEAKRIVSLLKKYTKSEQKDKFLKVDLVNKN